MATLRMRHLFALVASLPLAAASAADAPDPAAAVPATVAPATAPSTAPAVTPATAPTAAATKMTPEVVTILEQLSAAYGKLKSLDLNGTVSSNIDAAGQKHNDSASFTSSFEAPNKFRHAMKDEMIAGSTGQKAYAYLKSRNAYSASDAPAQRVATKQLPEPLPRIIEMQNPSLMLALAKDPKAELTENVTEIVQTADTKISDASYQTLRLDLSNKTSVTLLVDPATHLLRQSRTDLKSMLEQQGAPDVKSAIYTVDYTATTPDAPVKDGQFAWKAPEGARDLASAAAPEAEENPASSLQGKDAPDFKLTGLDGKAVTRADLKGSVFILDFWATWCGPCRKSLPHLNKVYDDKKASGLKVFAVNLQEDKDKVQKFVDQTKLTIPVLLDSQGETGQTFKAESIPETVLVGKDGKVKKVFIGFGPGTEQEMTTAIEAALKE